MSWAKLPAHEGPRNKGCLCCGAHAVTLPMGASLYVGFGIVTVSRDGERVWSGDDPGVWIRPTWEELRDARYALVPDEATMALLLPPRSEYVNVHDYCLQMYEIPGEYIERHQDRLA